LPKKRGAISIPGSDTSLLSRKNAPYSFSLHFEQALSLLVSPQPTWIFDEFEFRLKYFLEVIEVPQQW
jgi:hypothetical protein